MNIQNYGKISSGRSRTLSRRVRGIIIALIILFTGLFIIGILTDDGPEYQQRYSAIEENHTLKEQIAQLQSEIGELNSRVEELEGQLKEKNEFIDSLPAEESDEESEEAEDVSQDTGDSWTQVSPRSE